MIPVSVITASLPHRASLLVEAMTTVQNQDSPPRAHLVGIDQRGVAEVRNALIEAAGTPWVAFLDDDDRLDPDHLSTLWPHHSNADVIIPHCRFDGKPLPDTYCNRPYDRDDLRSHGIFPITVLARREAILDVGGFPTEGWDDWGLWNAMADAGATFEVVPTVTWTYRTSTPDRRTHVLQNA